MPKSRCKELGNKSKKEEFEGNVSLPEFQEKEKLEYSQESGYENEGWQVGK